MSFAYPLARSVLFSLDAELAHHLALGSLDKMARCGLAGLVAAKPVHDPRKVFGLTFANAVGLAAGLDKNGDHIDAMAKMGFGYLEIGTVTPRAQPGNPKPRMFRLIEHEGLINRLGFNNGGLDNLESNVTRSRYARDGGTLGINIGKNFDTPNDRAADDYLTCLARVWPLASYITVNISSPNTKNLRALQEGDALAALLQAIAKRRNQLVKTSKKRVPILLKIAPDLTRDQVGAIAQGLVDFEFDGVIGTNTTLSREGVEGHKHAAEAGGLSGAPVQSKANQVQGWLFDALKTLGSDLPIIGVGGIMSAADAARKMDLGAQLVQVYTGFIFHGPSLIHQAASAIAAEHPQQHMPREQRKQAQSTPVKKRKKS